MTVEYAMCVHTCVMWHFDRFNLKSSLCTQDVAVLCFQIYSLLGQCYRDNSAPAFALYKFVQVRRTSSFFVCVL